MVERAGETEEGDRPRALDVKAFVPTRDHDASIRFYKQLGWRCRWRDEGLAELELAGVRLLLQRFYVKEWAENSMIYIDVEDAAAWYERARDVVASFPGTRVRSPTRESYGALVTYVWDPAGVLLHFAQATAEEEPR